MAMTACRECGEFVSKSARTCPYCGKSHPGLRPMQFATIVIMLLVVGAGLAAAIDNQSSQPQAARAAPLASRSVHLAQARCTVSMYQYLALKSGMTYDTALGILGCAGEELSSVELADITTAMYMWRGNSFGGNMNAMFQNGRLVTKAQFGLK
jgi:hypothetical protein